MLTCRPHPRTLAALACLTLLASCAEIEQRRADLRAYLTASCERDGHAPDTPAFRGCYFAKARALAPPDEPMQRTVTCQSFGVWTQCN